MIKKRRHCRGAGAGAVSAVSAGRTYASFGHAQARGKGATFGLYKALQNQSCKELHPRQKGTKAMTPAIMRLATRSLPSSYQSLPAWVATLVLRLASVQLGTGETAASMCGQPVQAFESTVLQAWAHSLAF